MTLKKVRFFPKPSIASIFVKGVTQTCALGRIGLRENSVLRTENAESSKFLKDIVMTISTRYSDEQSNKDLNFYEKWKLFLETIATEQIIFVCLFLFTHLLSRLIYHSSIFPLFRPSLISIRTRFQLRAMNAQINHHRNVEIRISSPSTQSTPSSISPSADPIHTFQDLPFQFKHKYSFSGDHADSIAQSSTTQTNDSSSTITTETDLPPSIESLSSASSTSGKSLSDHSSEPSLPNSVQLSSSISTDIKSTPSEVSISHTSEPSLARSVQHSISIATDLQSLRSPNSLSHSSFLQQSILNIISTIHTILSAPSQISSFPQFRLASTFELDLLRFGQQHFERGHPDLDLTETFSPDLFDEEDDFVLVTTLWRCEAVLDETQSLSCILHQTEFITKLISALHSDNSLIRDRSGALFASLVCLIDCPDPLSPPYSSLRDAFREGTETEQYALLQLWILWMHKESRKTSHDRKMKESDFDFEGLLSVDLTNHIYSNAFLRFVMCLINADLNKTSSWMEMSLDWRVHFLLRFHNSNDLMSATAMDDVCYYACMLSH
ncbi:hypothetical protein BLNAU_18232 [Blattamonas nauphoetae]|uniref:Uncharacterized protein n=1 Tax=Blattamonas nauphoetae TaxID=2049346 RepID=A0ABQ9X506_9EUKA|nr:hypothetical protein BLNAU_18232 [Blattamonas nauphoetae]